MLVWPTYPAEVGIVYGLRAVVGVGTQGLVILVTYHAMSLWWVLHGEYMDVGVPGLVISVSLWCDGCSVQHGAVGWSHVRGWMCMLSLLGILGVLTDVGGHGGVGEVGKV